MAAGHIQDASNGAIGLAQGSNGAALFAQGAKSVLNISGSAKLVTDKPGRLARINVLVAGSAVGAAYDTNATGSAAAANQVFVIPNTVGSYLLDWPCASGIVVTPGTGQTVAVCYA